MLHPARLSLGRAARAYAGTLLSALILLCLSLSALSYTHQVAQAADFNVACNVTDLISAINTANDNGEADTLNLATGCTYTLGAVNNGAGGPNGLPAITSTITLNGNGATITRAAAGPDFRFFFVDPDGHLTLNNLTLQNGAVFFEFAGSAILNNGSLTVNGSTFTDNGGACCGTIAGSGTLLIENSTLADNANLNGGALYVGGTTTIRASTFVNNRSTANDGGAIFATGTGVMTITNSTFSGNTSAQTGGGLVTGFGASPAVTINNSTFFGNSAPAGGGALRLFGGSITLRNSIVANSPSGGNCFGVTSGGYNVSDDASCGGNDGDQLNTNPLLGPLADNGGPTQTHALLDGSPAIEAGSSTSCAATDQRGVTRPQGAGCDSGAYEVSSGTTITVNTLSDADDGVCNAAHCSLREAINAANAGPTTDTIAFNIPGEGVRTISVTSALPQVTQPVIIDGYTQPGASPNSLVTGNNAVLLIELDGSSAPGLVIGLDLRGGNSTVRGLVINRFSEAGLRLGSNNNVVEGNFIGTDATGTLDRGNGVDGIHIANFSLPGNDNRIGGTAPAARNVIAGNNRNGMVFDTVTGNVVQGNYIGTNAAGTATLPNSGAGIGVFLTGGLTIEGNLISGNGSNGIEINASPSTSVLGNRIGTNAAGTGSVPNGGHGVFIFNGAANNTIGGTGPGQGNTIANNALTGVQILGGTGNRVRGNAISNNGGLGLDLGGDGVTPNDAAEDSDTGPNQLQNFPIITSAVPNFGEGVEVRVEGVLNSRNETTFALDFYLSDACDPSGNGEGQRYLGSRNVTTGALNTAEFNATFFVAGSANGFVTATATDPNGNTSEFSACALTGPDNTAWPRALDLNLPNTTIATGTFSQFLDKEGQTRWYRFSVAPGSTLTLTLTGLETAYDFTVYKDIGQAYAELLNTTDSVTDTLNKLGAEFAPDIYSPDIYSPDIYSPDIYSPDIYSPDIYSPDIYSPDIYSPDIYSPDIYSPDIYSPDIYSPDIYSPADYSSAQQRSLVAVSPYNGTAQHGISINTWNNTGNYYVRVRGRNGAFSLSDTFTITVTRQNDTCPGLTPPSVGTSLTASGPNFRTLIVADWTRMLGTATEIATLQQQLATLAARAEVGGVIVNVGADARVTAANTLADANPLCVYAKNIVADSVKRVVDRYRTTNSNLQYIVLVGGDSVIPFFRYPDRAGLAPESNYVPPVNNTSASQASLRFNYVLGQDAYGAAAQISTRDDSLPIPGLAVGRLVETATEATTVVNAYLGANGVLVPQTSFVSGYDFLDKTARAVSTELRLGTGATPDELIADASVGPNDPGAWTADQLRARLFVRRNDLVFLAGHFSASSALAADYDTRMLAEEIITAPVNFTNTLVWSAGCHSGYNIVDADSTAATRQPDWAQAFARRGATLVAGTGYQYGDTDFIYYSEALYLAFSRQLRTGTGPVSIGQALVRAKQDYLTTTGPTRGIHEKSYLIATLFGLPMMQVNVPGARLTPPDDSSIVDATSLVSGNPGSTLGLRVADVTLAPSLTTLTKPVPTSSGLQTTTYFSGTHGVNLNPAEPVLPLSLFNVTANNSVLRGVGFRGGIYTDLANVRPLIAQPAFDLGSARPDFNSGVFYPTRLWRTNYFDALDGGDVTVRLMLTSAQFRNNGTSALGTLRRFNSTQFRLFYSNNLARFTTPVGLNIPGLSMPPAIAGIESSVVGDSVQFRIRVSGDPAAGMQAVWVTYTGESGPFYGAWQSLDLTRALGDSRVWVGTLPLGGSDPNAVRFMVQAANGVGLVTLASNSGAYYIPGVDNTPAAPQNANAAPTTLAFVTPPVSGNYGDSATFTLRLTSNGTPIADARLRVNLGPVQRSVQTGSTGTASVTFPLTVKPGAYAVAATHAGSVDYQPASASTPFTVNKQPTTLALSPASVTTFLNASATMTATLRDGSGAPLLQKPVLFVVTGAGGTFSTVAETNSDGQAALGRVSLPLGAYTVTAYFGSLVATPPLDLRDERYGPSTASGTLTIRPVFPTTPSLDDFNRRNGSLGANWRGETHGYTINGFKVRVLGGGPIYWNGSNPNFGVNQEAFVTLHSWNANTVDQALLLKVQSQSGVPGWQRGAIGVHFDQAAGVVRVETYRPGAGWTVYANIAAQFRNGDRLGARVLSTGQVLIFRNDVLVATVTLNANDRAFFNTKGGRIGLWYASAGDAMFDDFGGGTFIP